MARRPTIIDVAREASVSKSTVSLVLQNSPTVKAETREEVRAAMRRLGYVYNRSAANLRSAKTGLIGLVINDLRNPFFTEFAAAFQACLADRAFGMVLADLQESAQTQEKMISALIEHGVRAMVISPAYGGVPEVFAPIERAGIPTLQVFRQGAVNGARFPFIAPDYRVGGRLATEHLAQGLRGDIAFVGGLADRDVTAERMSGYLEVIAGMGQEPVVLPGDSSFAFGTQAAEALQRAHPNVSAALCFNDQVALGLMSQARSLGLDVPQRLRVVGFDDIAGCQQAVPQLSSVSCAIPEFARQVCTRLLSWLEDGQAPEAAEKTPVSLIVRGSSDLEAMPR